MGHHGRVDADGAGGDAAAQRLGDIGADRLARLGAEAAHPAGGVVARKGGQVDAADRIDQPGRLIA